MKQLLLLALLLPSLIWAQPAVDFYKSFQGNTAKLGNDTVKVWVHVPANYPASGGGVMLGLHGLGDPNSSIDIRTYLTATADANNLLLICPEPYLGNEDSTLLAKSRAVINQVMDSFSNTYSTDLSQTYICGYSAGSDVSAHYTLEDPEYAIKGFIWFAPGYYGSILHPNIDTTFAAPIPTICMCRGTSDFVSASAATSVENKFSGSEVSFLKVSPAGIAHTMNYPTFTDDIATCMNFINANSPTGISSNVAALSMQLMPNPVHDKLLVRADFKESCTVEVFDVLGKRVAVKGFGEGEEKMINTQGFANGVYMLKVTSANNNVGVMRFVKQ